MIISSLEKKNDSTTYIVTIDNEKYLLDEEVVLKYRLFPKTEIDDSILSDENDIKYVNRDNYFKVATPQVFTYIKIKEAYKDYDNSSTDDFSKLLNKGYKVDTIIISKITFKVTTIEDLILLKAYLNIENN